ncbi:MAG: DUF1349 domain-containing protein [Gemmataceae bacterium]|nr:DUF1349 domain-containing protein [Gemmataceae bacterium]
MILKLRLVLVALAACLIAGPAITGDKKTEKIEGWGTVTDPDGDCTVKGDKGKVTVTVPATNHNLHPVQGMNAPRVLREVEGDFTATVKVTGTFKPGDKATGLSSVPWNSAGLLLWDGDKNYLRLERTAYWRQNQELFCHAPGFEYWKDGKVKERYRRIETADFFKGKSTWLKLERRADNVTGFYSHDGKEWHEAKQAAVEFPKKVQIGVAAVNSSDAPFTVEFEELKVEASK